MSLSTPQQLRLTGKRSHHELYATSKQQDGRENRRRKARCLHRAVQSAPTSPEMADCNDFARKLPGSAPAYKTEFFPASHHPMERAPPRVAFDEFVVPAAAPIARTSNKPSLKLSLATAASPNGTSTSSTTLTASVPESASLRQPYPTLTFAVPKTPVSPVPSFSNRRQRNAKQLSLLVPSASGSKSSAIEGLLVPGPPSPGGSNDLNETRSCPPTPRLVLGQDTEDQEMIDVEKREELTSSLRGDMTMKRRTSLPRLNINATRLSISTARTVTNLPGNDVPPTPSISRPNKPLLPLTVENLVARNKEAGAPIVDDLQQALEDFPYQNGPKEILPGLYLGSEQNAKDPSCLRSLGIVSVLCVAKEVNCPWLLEDVIQEEDQDVEEDEEDQAGSLNLSSKSSNSESDSEQEQEHYNISSRATTELLSVPLAPTPGLDQLSQYSRSPSPSRPLLVRPTASTPNLQQRFREASPENITPSARPIPTRLPTVYSSSSNITARKVTPTYSGYLYRTFPANRRTGRPAIEYTKLPWGHDEDDIATHFSTYKICELIDKARKNGGRCLVHCQLGVSRSATLVIGVCMKEASLGREDALRDVKTMHDAYTFVRAKSRWVAPNIGLLAQLVQYERVLAASSSSEASLPYSNSAYYDSQLSLGNPNSPEDLSPSSNSVSEIDSRLDTPEARVDLHPPPSFHASLRTPPLSRVCISPIDEQLSPMTAALQLSKSTNDRQSQSFGSAQRKRDHRKTFSADFSAIELLNQ